ncbi:MAG TPA: SNF2-related protein, partial [Minicystis sp.]|nr:SNF2-related protein [Minicystis sp.]
MRAWSLRQIASWGGALSRVLDAPVEGVVDALKHAVGEGEVVDHLVFEHGCSTLREALLHQSADACLVEELPSNGRRREFVARLARFVLTSPRDAAPPRPERPEPRRPKEPCLVALLEKLEAERARQRAAIGRARAPSAPHAVRLRKEPLRLACSPVSYGPDVEIALETEPLRVVCSCLRAQSGACPDAVAALDGAIAMLHDERHPVRIALAEELARPAWERLLGAVDERLAAAANPRAGGAAERLVFRVVVFSPSMVSVELVAQKRLARGGWSKGQRLGLDAAVARRAGADGFDAPALEAMTLGVEELGSYAFDHPSRARVARVLEALVDHPRVEWAQTGERARVERARIGVSVVAGEAGMSLEATLAGRPIEASRLLDGATTSGRVIAVDAAARAVRIAELDPRAAALLAALRAHPSARIPVEGQDALLRTLQALEGAVDVALPEELRGEAIDGDARLVVRFTPRPPGLAADVALLVRPVEGGPSFAPGAGAAVVPHAAGGRRLSVKRTLEAEIAAAQAFAGELTLPAAAEPWPYRLDEASTLDVLAALRGRADAVTVEWPDDDVRIDVAGDARAAALKLRVTEARDWFGVDGGIEVDGVEVSFAALLEAARAGRRYVALGPRRFARLEDELRGRLARSADLVFAGRHGLEVSFAAAADLADLVEDPSHLEAAAKWRELVARIDAARTHTPAVPAELHGVLRPYQLEGFRWLARLAAWGIGGCLADDMGLGKTVQTLALLVERAYRGPALVVAPTSVAPNWIAEAARFAPGLRARLYRGDGRRALLDEACAGDVLVTSYALATRDAEALAAVRFSTLVLDEAQAIKNALTRRARAIRSLDAEFKVALTGTPVENHLGELWSLMRVLAPGLLGSWEQFRERFAVPIERGRDGARAAALSRVLRPFLLRRTKAEVAPELPPRIEVSRYVELSPAERRLYDEARRRALVDLAEGEGDARFKVLAALTRLRRLACHPRLVYATSTVASSKLASLLELVRELVETGHRALV